MSLRFTSLAALCLALALSGCITTADRSGDRARENGFWRREGLAMTRIVTSPVTVISAAAAPFRASGLSGAQAAFLCPWLAVWGCGETGEELAVGVAEALCGAQFESCAYPLERFRFDAEDWGGFAGGVATGRLADARTLPAEREPRTVGIRNLEARIGGAVAGRNWSEAARLCRLRMAASVDDLDRAICGVRLAMANWNAGDRIGAVIAMDLVVSLCARTGGAVRREAEAFRARLRSGDAPATFPGAEILPGSRVVRLIFAAAGT